MEVFVFIVAFTEVNEQHKNCCVSICRILKPHQEFFAVDLRFSLCYNNVNPKGD